MRLRIRLRDSAPPGAPARALIDPSVPSIGDSRAPALATLVRPLLSCAASLAVLVSLSVSISAAPAAGQASDGPSPRVEARHGLALARETHRIRIANRWLGSIEISRDAGLTWTRAGTVLRPDRGFVHEVARKEFTASDWAPDAAVAATAVNAIHIKVEQKTHACLFSLQPREFFEKTKEDQVSSYFAHDASIYTDIPGGTGIFGADLGPYLGDPVFVEKDGSLERLSPGFAPAQGAMLVIVVCAPEDPLCELLFENRFGGKVTATYVNGTVRTVARVLRPVGGIGRFGGTQLAGPGVVRANHPGVLCISTAPLGKIGGFQIVPSEHASDPDLDYVRGKPVWMVVGPVGVMERGLEGRGPLFLGHLKPRGGFVEVRVDGGPWHRVPEIFGLQENALLHVSHIRIRIP